VFKDEHESTRESGRGQLPMFGAVEEKVVANFPFWDSDPRKMDWSDFRNVGMVFSDRFESAREIC